MRQNALVTHLDRSFNIHILQPDRPFSLLLPEIYAAAGIDLTKYLAPAFLQSYHGLMMDNTDIVEKVYSVTFLSEEILSKIFIRDECNGLVISHHPMVMETSNRGFLPMAEAYFQKLRERALSVYVLHTPLDIHSTLSTRHALANRLGLHNTRDYYMLPDGPAGIAGRLPTLWTLARFLEEVQRITGVKPNFLQNLETTTTVGIVPGGVDSDGILETAEIGCDTLLTGTYFNQVQNDIGAKYRANFAAIKDELNINLVECSHYASEAVVMREDLVSYISNAFGLPCVYIPQDDPWY